MKSLAKQSISYVLILCVLASTVFFNPLKAEAKEKTGEQMVAEVIKELDLEDVSYFDKVIICGNWIACNIGYDYEGLEKGAGISSLQETMKERKGVCEGYANVFKEFMNQIGVPCLYISDSKMNHAYNMVLMNDYKWYLVEPQSCISADWEEDVYKRYIRLYEGALEEYKERYRIDKDEKYNFSENIRDYEEGIREYEEKLNLLNGARGELQFYEEFEKNNFLNGTTDFENYTIVPGSGYYEFVKLANKKIYGFQIATTKLRTDPDKDQKQLINKTEVKFTKSNITINAATSKAKIKLPISVKNYTVTDLDFYVDKFYTTNLSHAKQTTAYLIDEFLINSSGNIYLDPVPNFGNIYFNSSYLEGSTESLSFQLIAKTILGNQATTNITIKYPQLTLENSKLLSEGIKAGKRVKLSFTEGASIKDFDVSISQEGLINIEYDSKTGEIEGKKPGYAKIRLKSKINKNYLLSYTVCVK